MAVINFIVPGIHPEKFTGGILCVFEYANGLQKLGHDVHVTPLGRFAEPKWFRREFTLQHVSPPSLPIITGKGIRAAASLIASKNPKSKQTFREVLGDLYSKYGILGTFPFTHAAMTEQMRRLKGSVDVTIATSFETALPVFLYGKGHRMYFMQHYEPYFAIDYDRPEHARQAAEQTYTLPLHLVANSSWLAATVAERHGRTDVETNPNAIDQAVFFPEGAPPPDEFIVISYGGRNATWKGFKEAAEAIRIARLHLPHLQWHVYGDALLPPNNTIAPYKPLGFLRGADLRLAYSRAHVLLSASWYESFPLFPIEAMACGTAVVTTPYGTEDYAVHEQSALIAPARDPHAMAGLIIRLHKDQDLRRRIASKGLEVARQFTWERSAYNLDSKIRSRLQDRSRY